MTSVVCCYLLLTSVVCCSVIFVAWYLAAALVYSFMFHVALNMSHVHVSCCI